MLNPDGVVVGNYRCSLAGLDLNRAYQDPAGPGAGGLVPGVAAYKALLATLAEQQQVRQATGVGVKGCPGDALAPRLTVCFSVNRLTRPVTPVPLQVVLLVDFHGHSRKAGIFMYGCEKRPRDAAPAFPGWPVPGSRGGLPGVPPAHQERLFPALLAANVPHLFSYRACDFKVGTRGGGGTVVRVACC